MACKLSHRVAVAIFDSDLIATRLLLAFAEFLWAAMLFWPGETFGRPTYTLMSEAMPEDAWGVIFGLTACCQIAVVAEGRFLAREARAFAAWNASLWLFVVAMLLSVQPPPAAISGEIALALAAVWVWVRPMILASWYRKAYGRAHAQ